MKLNIGRERMAVWNQSVSWITLCVFAAIYKYMYEHCVLFIYDMEYMYFDQLCVK